jgi:Alpha-L-fucosidase
MWRTSVASFKNYDSTVMYDLYDYTVFKRDVLQELKDECDKQGIKFCLYYSILDWSHSSQIAGNYYSTMSSMTARTNYITDMKAQLQELMTKYKPAVMWFDGDWCADAHPVTLSNWWNKDDGLNLYQYIVGIDSNVIVNERVKRGFGLGDFECPEQVIPSAPLTRQWETCQTMNTAWGFDSSKEKMYKPASALIKELVTTVSRDGNYLLNIGPKGDGTVTAGATSILNSFGNWMSIYSESIYGTTRSPFTSEPSWGFYTKKQGNLYIHIFKWPVSKIVKVHELTNTVEKICLLNDTNTILSYVDSSGYMKISLPASAPNSVNSVLVARVSGIPVQSTAHIKISRILISGGNIINGIGSTLQLMANLTPLNAENKSVRWSIPDAYKSMASVDSSGLVTALGAGRVTIYATADDGSDVSATIFVTINTTQSNIINPENNDNKILLYPNPVTGSSLYINQDTESVLDITITNISGQTIKYIKTNGRSLALDIASIPGGLYFLKAYNGSNTIVQKFVKL